MDGAQLTELQQVRSGMIVANHVFDAQEQLLIMSGQKISADIILLLTQHDISHVWVLPEIKVTDQIGLEWKIKRLNRLFQMSEQETLNARLKKCIRNLLTEGEI